MYQFEMHDADHPDHKLKNRPILYEFHITLQGFCGKVADPTIDCA